MSVDHSTYLPDLHCFSIVQPPPGLIWMLSINIKICISFKEATAHM